MRVQTEHVGMCVEPEHADELAARVLELSQKPELCQQLGRNGRTYVIKHFDRTALARKLSTLIETVGHMTSSQSDKMKGLCEETWERYDDKGLSTGKVLPPGG